MSLPQASSRAPLPADESCDVMVVGGGPAGSTIAALLAEQGRKVVLLEKAHHPRFHIGESLLPGNVELFEKLGVRDQVEKIGMPKFGIEFVSPEHEHRSYVEFAEGLDKTLDSAWQVRRSDLDEILFRNAATRGAQTIEGCKVRDVAFDADGAVVQAEMDDGARRSWRARFVVDATGRDTLLANKFRCKQKNPDHNSTALFGHFTNAERLEGKKEGNISICWFPHGWFWFIPLADGTTSIGAVCWPYYLKTRDKPLKEFFSRHHRAVPGAGGAPEERHAGRRRGACHGQLLVLQHARHGRALPDAGRRLHLHRPDVLLGRVPGHDQRLRRREAGGHGARRAGRAGAGAQGLRGDDAQGPARVLVVHLPRDQPDHPRHVHAPGQPVSREGRV
jgi:flavin-dependent dehydrogenase